MLKMKYSWSAAIILYHKQCQSYGDSDSDLLIRCARCKLSPDMFEQDWK